MLKAEVLQDVLAVLVAHIVTAANKCAHELGVHAQQSIVTVNQVVEGEPYWRISYCPKDFNGRRGGDLIVEVDSTSGDVKRVLRGQ